MFALRGWLLAIVGGLLAAYYTDNIDMNELVLRVALPVVALLFLIVESRHVNLVEAVAQRALTLEKRIADARQSGVQTGWYDGPRVSRACQEGAHRKWPRRKMTFVINQPFYIVVILIIILITVSLPSKRKPPQPEAPNAQPAQK
jgi:hypothetical protein